MSNTCVDECYTYLWHRGAEKLGLLKYARWKAILKYNKPALNDDQLRRIFRKLVEAGYLIAHRRGKRTHYDYIFSQKPLYNILDKEDYIKEMTKADPHVVFE